MAEKRAGHEDLSRDDGVKAGSERSFGIVFTVVFAVVGLFPLLDGGAVRAWALVVAGVFLGLALVAPRLLAPLNRLWFLFGQLLHRVVSPLVMGLIFFTAVTPTALIMRLAGKDPLHRTFEPDAKSYWIERQPPGPEPDTMKYQY